MRPLPQDLDTRELLKASAMMTDAQRERLPEILRDIVHLDRALASVRAQISGPIVSFAAAREARPRFQVRRELTAAAAHLYGPRASGNGPAWA